MTLYDRESTWLLPRHRIEYAFLERITVRSQLARVFKAMSAKRYVTLLAEEPIGDSSGVRIDAPDRRLC